MFVRRTSDDCSQSKSIFIYCELKVVKSIFWMQNSVVVVVVVCFVFFLFFVFFFDSNT